jgi:hypothetical protein
MTIVLCGLSGTSPLIVVPSIALRCPVSVITTAGGLMDELFNGVLRHNAAEAIAVRRLDQRSAVGTPA